MPVPMACMPTTSARAHADRSRVSCNLHAAGCIETCFDFAYFTSTNSDLSDKTYWRKSIQNIIFLIGPKHAEYTRECPLYSIFFFHHSLCLCLPWVD